MPRRATKASTMSEDPGRVDPWSPRRDRRAAARFLDVLGESTSSPVPTVAQRAMNSLFVATVYERLWRPTAFYIASGVPHRAEQHRAASALHLSTAQRFVDVACGPGNFTGPLAEQLPDGASRSDSIFPRRCLQFVAAAKPG